MAKITYYKCDICNKAYNELYEKTLRPTDFDSMVQVGTLDICPVCHHEIRNLIRDIQAIHGVLPIPVLNFEKEVISNGNLKNINT